MNDSGWVAIKAKYFWLNLIAIIFWIMDHQATPAYIMYFQRWKKFNKILFK